MSRRFDDWDVQLRFPEELPPDEAEVMHQRLVVRAEEMRRQANERFSIA